MSEPVTNIVLVGRTGNGKSATGNSILGKPRFQSALQAGGVTTKCEMHRAAIQDGPIINVIDTPGLFDLSVPADYVSKEIIRCLTMAEGGIHALLFVLSVKTRITQEEEATVNTLQLIFESRIFDYLIVVFTGGDELEWNKQTLKDYLRDSCPGFFTRILKLSGGRTVLFNNMTKDEGKKAKQLNKLLAHVEAIGDNNGGKPYTDKMHRQIKEEDNRLMEQQSKFYSKQLAAETALKLKNLKFEHDRKLRRMAQILEKRLRESKARPPQYYPFYDPTPQQSIRPSRYVPVYHSVPEYDPVYHLAPQNYVLYYPASRQNYRVQQPPVNQMRPMAPPPPPECNIM